MKKIVALLVSLAMVFTSFLAVFSDDVINIRINGEEKIFDQMPIMISDRVLVPMRGIFEALGASVDWDDATSTVTAKTQGVEVKLTIGKNEASINGDSIMLDVAPQLINSRTMVPVRFVSEALKKDVKWIDESNTVEITGAGVTSPTAVRRNIPTDFTLSNRADDFTYYTANTKSISEFVDSLGAGETVISTDASLKYVKNCATELGKIESAEITDGNGFTKVIRATVVNTPENSSGISITFNKGLDEVTPGDVCVVKLWARTTEGGSEGQGTIQVQVQNPTTYAKALFAKAVPQSTWTRIYMPFVAKEGATQVGIRFGFDPQVIEVGNVEIVNYKDAVSFSDFPTDTSSISNEFKPDAAWRKDALARIEKIRKGDLAVVVKDAQGNVIPDADVSFNMYEHDFEFGTCITSHITSNEEYKKHLAENFNSAVVEHFMKWGPYAADGGVKAEQQVNAAVNLGIKNVRGHSLVWEKEKSLAGTSLMPDDVFEVMNDKQALYSKISTHMNGIMGKYKGVIKEWDVENEMVSNSLLRKIHGNEMLIDVYNMARQADPSAQLWYNETIYNDKMWELIDFMAANNVDCDGIGIQSHYDSNAPTPTSLDELYNKIGQKGFRTKVTEFSALKLTEDLKADLLRDTMIVSFANEHVDGFYMWGFWDGTLNNNGLSPLYDNDWNLRESGKVYQDLVYNKWWTKDATTKTAADGKASVKGFYGDYDVTVNAGGRTKTVSCSFSKLGNSVVEIVLD